MKSENTLSESGRSASPVKSSNGKWESKTSDMSSGSLAVTFDEATKTAKIYFNRLLEAASEGWSTLGTRTTRMVRQYPVQATVSALAIGILLGAAVRRKRA